MGNPREAMAYFESRIAPRVEAVTMVFVTIHLAFLVFGVTGFGILFAFTEVRLPFLGPRIRTPLRLSLVRVGLFLHNQARRRNGETGWRRRLTDEAHAKNSHQSRPQHERENRKFHIHLAFRPTYSGYLSASRIDGRAIQLVSGGFCI
jgi:hypothetical protein